MSQFSLRIPTHPPPLPTSLLPIHAVSIPACKGHPGNRAAAVDSEINKQKKREESNGGQSPAVAGVNCRPASQEHTPAPPGLGGAHTSDLCFFNIFIFPLRLVFPANVAYWCILLFSFSFFLSFRFRSKSAVVRPRSPPARESAGRGGGGTESSRGDVTPCLLAAIRGEAEKSLPLSRRKPKRPADPWMTHSHTHTHTEGATSANTQQWEPQAWWWWGGGTTAFLLFGVDPCAKSSQRVCVCVSIRAADGTVKDSPPPHPPLLALALPELQKWAALPDPLQTILHSVCEGRVGCISWTWD